MQPLSIEMLALGVVWYVVFVFSTTLHEAAHALAAQRLGDDTARRAGQLTLDPRPHIAREPFGMVIFPVISYMMGGWMMGWASVPLDPYWAARHPKRAAWMALAGPLGNLLLVLASGLLIRLGVWLGLLVPPELLSFTHMTQAVSPGWLNAPAMLVSLFFSLNLMLAFFNLLPVPPLDGSSAINLLLSRSLRDKWGEWVRNPAFAFLGIFLAWKIFGPLFQPIRALAIWLLYPDVRYF